MENNSSSREFVSDYFEEKFYSTESLCIENFDHFYERLQDMNLSVIKNKTDLSKPWKKLFAIIGSQEELIVSWKSVYISGY